MAFVKFMIAMCIVIIGIRMSRSIPILAEQTNESNGSRDNSAPGEVRSEVRKQRGRRIVCVRWDKKGRCLYATMVEGTPPPEVQSDEDSGSGSGDDMILQDWGNRWYRCSKQDDNGRCVKWEFMGGIVPIWARPGRR